ncbi:MAG: hypothetical protein MUP55_01750 [Candidatus Aenigmarchaeota archaeon]|nr:hypothetical protein [Candidatus Aenigmarchaeota archaeon]
MTTRQKIIKQIMAHMDRSLKIVMILQRKRIMDKLAKSSDNKLKALLAGLEKVK